MAAVIQFNPWTVESAKRQGKTMDDLAEEYFRARIAEATKQGEAFLTQYSAG